MQVRPNNCLRPSRAQEHNSRLVLQSRVVAQVIGVRCPANAHKTVRSILSDAIRPALGTSGGGHITVAPGLGAAEEFSVIVHEVAHELLHHGVSRPASKAVRETEAEATAFAVCRHIGLETGTAAHDYIALYNGDRGALLQSLTTIRDAAAKIIIALDDSDKTDGVPA